MAAPVRYRCPSARGAEPRPGGGGPPACGPRQAKWLQSRIPGLAGRVVALTCRRRGSVSGRGGLNRAWTPGKRAIAIALAASLVLLAAAPVEAYWRAGFWVGLGTGALLAAPFGGPYTYGAYPYAHPYAYPHPYYAPYPVYVYPPLGVSMAPPPAAPTPTTPAPPLAPPGPAAPAPSPSAGAESVTSSRCETVWIEGHYETHIGPSGQAATVWVPAGSRQLCQ
jgi:hypothetical protein